MTTSTTWNCTDFTAFRITTGRVRWEFGYRTNDINAVNKTGIGTAQMGFTGLTWRQSPRDQLRIIPAYWMGLPWRQLRWSNAAGTSPTLDNTTTSVWGNGANYAILPPAHPYCKRCILHHHSGHAVHVRRMCIRHFARSTNASGLVTLHRSLRTRVITFTLNGTLTASTVYANSTSFLTAKLTWNTWFSS